LLRLANDSECSLNIQKVQDKLKKNEAIWLSYAEVGFNSIHVIILEKSIKIFREKTHS
jgi:hypothetical protein